MYCNTRVLMKPLSCKSINFPQFKVTWDPKIWDNDNDSFLPCRHCVGTLWWRADRPLLGSKCRGKLLQLCSRISAETKQTCEKTFQTRAICLKQYSTAENSVAFPDKNSLVLFHVVQMCVFPGHLRDHLQEFTITPSSVAPKQSID